MTQSPWGSSPNSSAPTQWQRGQNPWNAGGAPFGGQGWSNAPAPGGFPPPQAPAPRPPRRSFFGGLIRAALFIFLALTVLSVVRGFFSSQAEPTPTPTRTSTTTTRTTTTSSTTAAANPTLTMPGTAAATPAASGAPTANPTMPGGSTGGGTTTGNGTGTTQYQNEGYEAPPADFNPPELPTPETYSEAGRWLTNNAIYGQNVPSPTNCTMQPIVANASKADLERELNDMMGCLMQVWEAPMVAAGYEMPRPPVTVYTSAVTTACGTMKEVNAAYCAGDQRVYYAKQLLNALPDNVANTKYAAEEVIAHEFGHAVQARTGILISDKALESRASDAEAVVMSRRTEMQADCFGGLYVQSVAQSQGLAQADQQALVDMTYYLGDDVLSGRPNIDGDHGLGKNRQAWFAKGLSTNQIGACNTYTVPATQVR